MSLHPPTRRGWVRRAFACITTAAARLVGRRCRLPVLGVVGRLRGPEIVIQHHRDADVRAWAVRYLPCSFTASDGFVHVITRVVITADPVGVKVRLEFAWSMWTNAEDEAIARQLAQGAALGLSTWLLSQRAD